MTKKQENQQKDQTPTKKPKNRPIKKQSKNKKPKNE